MLSGVDISDDGTNARVMSMMRSSEGATNTALKTSQRPSGNIQMARLGILTLSLG